MMKRIFSIVFLSVLSQLVIAQGIEFFQGSFEEAKAEARAQGKLIFMDAYGFLCLVICFLFELFIMICYETLMILYGIY